MRKLSAVAARVATLVREDAHVYRFTIEQQKDIIRNAVSSGRVKKAELKQRVQDEI